MPASIRFFEGLQADGLTGPEQLVSDYLKALSTFEWGRLRKTEGFDYVFVDEMHLFDEQERFVIHQLLSNDAIRPRVAMAIDPKQSSLAIFVNHDRSQIDSDSSQIYKRARLLNPRKLELTTSFRNTLQIRAFVEVLIDELMLPDMHDDWDTPRTISPSNSKSGDLPEYQVHQDSTAQLKYAFDTASKLARQGTSAGG